MTSFLVFFPSCFSSFSFFFFLFLSRFRSNFILFRFPAEEILSSCCCNRFYVSLCYYYNIYFPFALSASYVVLTFSISLAPSIGSLSSVSISLRLCLTIIERRYYRRRGLLVILGRFGRTPLASD